MEELFIEYTFKLIVTFFNNLMPVIGLMAGASFCAKFVYEICFGWYRDIKR